MSSYPTTAQPRIGQYRGHAYRILWSGQTKYGQRAHLQYRDGSRDFWVDAAQVSTQGSTDSEGLSIRSGASYRAGVTAPHGRTCPECGSRECAKAWNPRDLCGED